MTPELTNVMMFLFLLILLAGFPIAFCIRRFEHPARATCAACCSMTSPKPPTIRWTGKTDTRPQSPAGAGFRWNIQRNVNLRFDLARVMDDGGSKKAGDLRGHISVFFGY